MEDPEDEDEEEDDNQVERDEEEEETREPDDGVAKGESGDALPPVGDNAADE
jgi:Ran GTPase-activating protein 1